MQIKRDYTQPFFNQRRKRKSHFLRYLLLFIGMIAFVAGVIVTQPALVTSAAYSIMGVQMTPTPLPSQLATRADNLYWTGQLEDAAELLGQAVAQRPDNVDYLYEHGQILIDLNRAEEAEAHAERINAINPQDVRGFALRARALTWQGAAAEAIPVALAGLQVDPNFAPLYEALSRAYTATAAWREGQEYGEMAIQLDGSDVRNHWAYASSLTQVGAHDAAMFELERAIEVHPYFLPPYFELAYLYLSRGRDQEAIDMYNMILGIQPRNARALLRQCDAYRKVGEFERARGLCEDAVRADPAFVPAQYRLGLLTYNDREFTTARDAFTACLEYEQGNLECHFRLGLTHYYLDDCLTAWTMLQDSLVMAQAQEARQATIDLIREGLSAIDNDPKCRSSANQRS